MIFILFLIGCEEPNKNLIIVKNDKKIDLTNLNLVRENLKGFWLLDNNGKNINEEKILNLNFKNNVSIWDVTKYNNQFFNKSFEITTCQPIAKLIKINDSICIQFTNLCNCDTHKIEYLSKTKLIVNGMKYLKHKGYNDNNFLND